MIMPENKLESKYGRSDDGPFMFVTTLDEHCSTQESRSVVKVTCLLIGGISTLTVTVAAAGQ